MATLHELPGLIAGEGAFWIANKKLAATLGLEDTVILMELIYAAMQANPKGSNGWFSKTKEDLLKIIPLGATGIQIRENKLIQLNLIQRKQVSNSRRNEYLINVDNVDKIVKDPRRYITKISYDLLSSNAKKKSHYFDPQHALENNASSIEKQRCYNTGLKNCCLLRKQVKAAKRAAALRSAAGIDIVPMSVKDLKDLESMLTTPSKRRTLNIVPIVSTRDDVNIFPISTASNTVPVDRAALKRGLHAKASAVVIGRRKLVQNTIDIINYWNSMPGVRIHTLKQNEDGNYMWGAQTKVIQEINAHVIKLFRGELYAHSNDIVQPVVRTMKFSMDSIQKAIFRASKSTSVEYGGTVKKRSLNTFFFNAIASVYPENGNSMYKYKYPFLHYVNGDLIPLTRAIKGDSKNGENHGIAATVLKKFQEEGYKITNSDRGSVSRAVDVAMQVYYANKSRWKQSEIQMMTEFPHILFSCFRDRAKDNNNINDLWFVAKFKFEQHLLDKRYI